MLWKILFCVAYLAITHKFCYCDVHTYGSESFPGKLIFQKKLFDQVEDEGVARLKNYTLIFKYINENSSSDITRAVFNVMNAKSKEKFDVKIEDDKKTLQAMLYIENGNNVKVTADIYGPQITTMSSSAGFLEHNRKKIPKTMTVIYGHNSTQTRNRKIILGHRQNGDVQLDHQTQIVKFKYNFAESEFNYPRPGQSQSTFITAVAFSFDTSSALAFLNSTFITENKFDAIVYDLNFPEFRANMTVYGYTSYNKPSTYKPIVLTDKNQATV